MCDISYRGISMTPIFAADRQRSGFWLKLISFYSNTINKEKLNYPLQILPTTQLVLEKLANQFDCNLYFNQFSNNKKDVTISGIKETSMM